MQSSPETWTSRMSDAQAAAYLNSVYDGFEQASLFDSDEATAQTVRYMGRLVRHSLSDPVVANAWRDAWTRFGKLANGDEAQVAWWYARHLVKFVHHQRMLVHWMGKPNELQLLISPEALLKMERPAGDCAVFTTLIEALLSYRGIGWETVTVAVNPMRPELYTHVYPQAIRPDGSRIALDASHGKYPGWQAPAARVIKKKCGTSPAMKYQEVN